MYAVGVILLIRIHCLAVCGTIKMVGSETIMIVFQKLWNLRKKNIAALGVEPASAATQTAVKFFNHWVLVHRCNQGEGEYEVYDVYIPIIVPKNRNFKAYSIALS